MHNRHIYQLGYITQKLLTDVQIRNGNSKNKSLGRILIIKQPYNEIQVKFQNEYL